jgi:hypothetical protein
MALVGLKISKSINENKAIPISVSCNTTKRHSNGKTSKDMDEGKTQPGTEHFNI